MNASSGLPPAGPLASPLAGPPASHPAGSSARSSVSRRGLLAGALSLGGAVSLSGVAATPAVASPPLWERPNRTGAPRVGGLHLQFGSDASREVVVSWHTTASVSNPRVSYGTSHGGFGRTEQAESRTYRDAGSGTEVQVHHARITGLRPDTDYVYAAAHDGATPELGTVRTAPRGRAAFTFTSFGDQGTPTLGKQTTGGYANDNLGSPAAGDTTAGVERIAPLFHLLNGDLCYANLSTDRVRTWSDWFESPVHAAPAAEARGADPRPRPRPGQPTCTPGRRV
ncbi:fibronectin type III domain-containing protein [Kitasatospora sp. NPDC017646]|uniref:fibronectin type III domain-containing protein n=1 Tax=Kitasatospora sp. NPDC017646 TaxID=3364024 RepID=UPI00379B7C98